MILIDVTGVPCWFLQMNVHRLRFVPHNVQAINCLAFAENGKLALSRADGSLELWNPAENWLQEVVIHSDKDSSIEGLVFYGDRLFTAGLNGLIQEWDMSKQRPIGVTESFGIPVWCLSVNHVQGLLAAGCEDGSTKLYGISDDNISYDSTLSKQEGRVMSIAWSKLGKYIITGGVDSTIRKYKLKSRSCELRITLDEHQHSKDTVVWDLKCLSDNSIVSALSTGKLQIYDGKLGTLRQSFELSAADLLTLAVSDDEKTLFTSGIDQKVTRLKWVASSNQFVVSESVLVHSHDVRALAISPSGQLVSGGVDTQLVLYSQEQFGVKRLSTVFPPFPHHHHHYQLVGKFLVVQQLKCLQFWKLQTVPEDFDTKSSPYHPIPQYLLRIKTPSEEHIKCFAVSSDAKLCAVATGVAVWIYRLYLDDGKVASLATLDYRAYRMKFLFQEKLFLCSIEGTIDIAEGINYLEQLQVISTKCELPFVISTNCVGDRVAVSYISQPGLVVCPNDNQLVKNIPKLPSVVTAINFVHDNIVLCCASHEIYCYDLTNDQLKQWITADASSPLRGPIIGTVFTQLPKSFMVLYSHHNLVLIRHQVFQQVKTGTKRKLDTHCWALAWSDLSVQTPMKCDYILYASLVDAKGDLCVVEKPWEDVLSSLPPALLRYKYGTS